MSAREKRLVQNENLFREVNERIADLEERISVAGDMLPLICECANTGCATVIEVEHAAYRSVRDKPRRFLVAPGHERLDDETVVGRGASYLIVEKLDPS